MKISEKYKGVSLMRGYVFKSVFSGEPELCQGLVQVITGMRINKVEFSHHEVELEPSENKRAGRIDLLVVDEEGNRYDIEVQASDKKNVIQRARHYQALMDVVQLKKGTDAKKLKKSVVIFICNFDPLKGGLARYDTYTYCEQTKEAVDDGRLAIHLSTVGDRSGISPELSTLLDVFSGEYEEDSDDHFISDIMNKIKHLYNDKAWMESNMTLEEEMRMLAEDLAQDLAEDLAEKKVAERLPAEVEKGVAERLPVEVDKRVRKMVSASREKLADAMGSTGAVDADALLAVLEQTLLESNRESAGPASATCE